MKGSGIYQTKCWISIERSYATAQSLAGDEVLRRTKVRVAAEMQARTDQRIATLLSPPSKSPPARHSSGPIRSTPPSTKAERSRAIFLKRDIPTHIDALKFMQNLMTLWPSGNNSRKTKRRQYRMATKQMNVWPKSNAINVMPACMLYMTCI